MADTWNGTSANEVPNYAALKDAVNNGDLACDSGSNCTGLSYSDKRNLNWSALDADFAFDSPPSGNKVPSKSEIETHAVTCPDIGTENTTSPSASVCDPSETCGDGEGCCYISYSWDNTGADTCWDVQIQYDDDSNFGSPFTRTVSVNCTGCRDSIDLGFCHDLNSFTTYHMRSRYRNPETGETGPWSSTVSESTHGCDGQA